MRSRLFITLGVAALWMAAIVARLVQLQVVDHERYVEAARQRQQTEVMLHSPRGTIYDARGRPLAMSAMVRSAWAVPAGCKLCPSGSARIEDPKAAAAELSRLLGIDRKELARRLAREGEFAWVARKLTEAQVEALQALDLEGLGFLWEAERFYPYGQLAAPVIGFVGMDHEGLYGLEQRAERVLGGQPVTRKLLVDALKGRIYHPALSVTRAEPGNDLYLTLDANIQYIAERELERAVARHGAKSGSVVVLDPATGAVLAMATAPAFDPNYFSSYPSQRWRNRPTMDAVEPGSSLKMVTAAAALEANLMDPEDTIDCERGGVAVDGVWIKDHHPFDELTFREVIAKSSNVGVIKLGLEAGRERMLGTLQDFGFGSAAGIDLPGEAAGSLAPLANDLPRATAYASFGHGLSVTPLQLANAYAAVASGGVLHRPYVMRSVGRAGQNESATAVRTELGRPITAQTARSLGRMLESVVEEGTGRKAAIAGFRVAGKTGTAQKIVDGRYSWQKYLSTFVGFAPSRRPAVVALVAIDEPSAGLTDGGDVAAPVWASIVEPVLYYLGVSPDFPGEADGRLLADLPAGAPAGGEYQPALPAVTPVGTVPDFTGLSLRQAVVRSAALGVDLRPHGSGFVERQSPEPGTPLAAVDRGLELWFEVGAL